jgi:hypothetical protein
MGVIYRIFFIGTGSHLPEFNGIENLPPPEG